MNEDNERAILPEATAWKGTLLPLGFLWVSFGFLWVFFGFLWVFFWFSFVFFCLKL